MSPSSPNHHTNIRSITNGVAHSNSPSPTAVPVSSTSGVPIATAVAAAANLSVNPVSIFSARPVAAVPVLGHMAPVITTSTVTGGTMVAAVAASPSPSSNSVLSVLGNIAHQPIPCTQPSSVSSLIPTGVNVSKALEMFMVTTAQTPLPIIALSGGAGHTISNSRTMPGNVSCTFTPTTSGLLQDDPFINSTTRIRPFIDGGPSTITTRVTTLERRENTTHHNYQQILSHNTYRYLCFFNVCSI